MGSGINFDIFQARPQNTNFRNRLLGIIETKFEIAITTLIVSDFIAWTADDDIIWVWGRGEGDR